MSKQWGMSATRAAARMILRSLFLVVLPVRTAVSRADEHSTFVHKMARAKRMSNEQHSILHTPAGFGREEHNHKGSSACKCTTCSGSEIDKMALPHLTGECNLCKSAEAKYGVVCLKTGLWRAEYCFACTHQQKEDGVVCSKWKDDLYVEVLRSSKGPHARFLTLHGRCGLCYKRATFGCASTQSPQPSPLATVHPTSSSFPSIATRPMALSSACNSSVGAPRWCSTHKSAQHVMLLPHLCRYVHAKSGACRRAAHMCRLDVKPQTTFFVFVSACWLMP